MRRSAPLILAWLTLAACGKEPAPPPEADRPAASTAPAAGQLSASKTESLLAWVETDPKQCSSNPWDKYTGLGGMPGFFASKGIRVYDDQTLSYNLLYAKETQVCQGCDCPVGHVLYLQVADKDVAAMAAFGFKRAAVDPLDANAYYGSRQAAAPVPATSVSPKPAAKPPAEKKKKRRRRGG